MENWINPGAIASLITVLVTFVGAIGVFVRDRRKEPIDKQTAEAAVATSISTASKQTIEGAILLNDRLEKENSKLVAELMEEQRIVTVWKTWYNILVDQWAVLRNNEEPPAVPNIERT